jgi:hypothetical protein
MHIAFTAITYRCDALLRCAALRYNVNQCAAMQNAAM